MTFNFDWESNPEDVFKDLVDQFGTELRAGIYAILKRYEPEIEAWLKANAPWTDQTGNLRQSLWADVQVLTHNIMIQFDYGLDYGVFLEFKNAGKFAVITPAYDLFAPRIFADIKAFVESR